MATIRLGRLASSFALRRFETLSRCRHDVAAVPATSRGIGCASECCKRRRIELIGLLDPASASSFPTSPSRCSSRLRLPDTYASGSSSRALFLPFRVNEPTPARSSCPGHLPWASIPLRGASWRSPHTRASRARYVPSSTFLTSPTVSSSTNLCGFISPRNHVQGSLFRVFPSRVAARARRPPLPSCRCPTPLPEV